MSDTRSRALLVAGVVAWVGVGACVLLLVGAHLGLGYLASEVVVVVVALVGARRKPGPPVTGDTWLTEQWLRCLGLLCVAVALLGAWTTFQQPRPLATLVGVGTALAAVGVAFAARAVSRPAGSSGRPARR